MNLLPFVTFFLILFSLSSLLLLQERKASISELKGHAGHLNIERHLLTRAAEKDFSKLGTKKKTKTEESKKKKKKNVAVNHRTKTCVHPHSKINIGPLVTKEHPLLYKAAANLIRVLYEKTSLWKEEKDWEYRLLDLLLKNIKSDPDLKSFNALSFKDPELGETLYKMVKGTQIYTLMTSEGYPPLGNYLALGEKNVKHAIRFRFSSYPVLIALFGQETADKIIEEEIKNRAENKDKYAPLKQKELETLLMKDQKTPRNFTDLEGIVTFSTEGKKSSYYIIEDPVTGLQLHKTSH